ncbi:hypothetical protein [Pseudoduganella lutea]|uniref:Uncharacterized protein n=1 Tax=Pseudoduganella lutea TaxID=321985 RepID=A0A4P6L3L2_9BURK|nr:hypothetical protein [Pseudoduganella lutea]QBE66004.1 hypothetical protein EWM63_25965 [Pseudoduganella lutea]
MRDSRRDTATARTIDIALILLRLRGMEAAMQYLQSAHTAEDLVERVLSSGVSRTSMTALPAAASASVEPAPDAPKGPGFYHVAGRRRDVVHAAVVEAAITLAGGLDIARAERMLRREALPDDVIARVLGQDESRRRTR